MNELFSPNIFKEHLKCCFKSEFFKIAKNELARHLIALGDFSMFSSYISFPNKTLFLWQTTFPVLSSNSPSIVTIIKEFFGSPAFNTSVSFSKNLNVIKLNISSKNFKFNFFKSEQFINASLIIDAAKTER